MSWYPVDYGSSSEQTTVEIRVQITVRCSEIFWLKCIDPSEGALYKSGLTMDFGTGSTAALRPMKVCLPTQLTFPRDNTSFVGVADYP